MEKYKEYYERINNGERDIDIALEAGHSVSTLYQRFTDYGIISTKKRRSSAEWEEQFAFFQNGKTVATIAKDLEVQLSTVYNHFALLGYTAKSRSHLDKEQLLNDYHAGTSVSSLAKKYKRTMTYIRSIIRRS